MKRFIYYLAAIVVGIVIVYVFFQNALDPMSATGARPVISYPTTLDLGEVESDTVQVMPFEIQNTGDAILEIGGITSSCLCTGLEKKDGDKFIRIERLSIAPGSSFQAFARMKIPKYSDYQYSTQVQFTTNDPEHPSCALAVLVKKTLNGISAEPKECLLGQMLMNEPTKAEIVLHDRDHGKRTVKVVEALHPQLIEAVFTKSNSDALDPSDIIGKIKITPRSVTGLIQTELVVYFSDGRMLVIPVTGRVIEEIEVLPNKPRFVLHEGHLTATVHCTSHRGLPISCRAETADKSLQISYDTGEAAKGNCSILFAVDSTSANIDEYPVRVVITSEGKKIVKDLTLRNGARKP